MAPKMLPTQMRGAGSIAVHDLISGPIRPAQRLGVFPAAAYLRLSGGEVMALLTHDAVRLPIGLVLPTSAADYPLDRLDGQILVGSSEVRIGDWGVRLSRLVSVRAPMGLTPNKAATEHACATLSSLEFAEHDAGLLDALSRDAQSPRAADLAHCLIGAGSGLTPSGDDVLAGFLIAARSFGVAADCLRAAVLAAATGGTTDLSAALLAHACRGESIPQLSAVLLALSASTGQDSQLDSAQSKLIRVGHTSGVALATGVLAAAKAAVHAHAPTRQRPHLLAGPSPCGAAQGQPAPPRHEAA